MWPIKNPVSALKKIDSEVPPATGVKCAQINPTEEKSKSSANAEDGNSDDHGKMSSSRKHLMSAVSNLNHLNAMKGRKVNPMAGHNNKQQQMLQGNGHSGPSSTE